MQQHIAKYLMFIRMKISYYFRNEFAYSSSDKMVYIRKFATGGMEMVLLNTLQGHEAEVTCVKWSTVKHKWITGSEDGTVRIWVLVLVYLH